MSEPDPGLAPDRVEEPGSIPPPREVNGKPSARELAVWGLLVLVILGLVGLSIGRQFAQKVAPPPVLGDVPAFALTDRDGATITSGDLAGAPYVSDFFFTRCVSICPRLTQQMQHVATELDRRLGADHPVRLVSFSVDPEHDTPAVLDAYAQRFDPPPRWHFLTGERDAVYALISGGFKLVVDDTPDPARTLPGDDILHSNRLVVVDADGRIRGYHDAFDAAAVEQLLDEVGTLVE